MPLIGFLTDGNPQLGMGHVYRCLVLARELMGLDSSARVRFDAQSPAGLGVLTEAGLGPVQAGELDNCLPAALDILIVDRLSSDPLWLARMKERCARLTVLDDTGPGHYLADLAVNALYACKVCRPEGTATQDLSGLDYIVLDPVFARLGQDARAKARHLFVSQGGADTYGLLQGIVETLMPWLDSTPDVELHVHTGPAFLFESELQGVMQRLRCTIHLHQRVPDMAVLMAGMDVAVCAGGVMSLELAALGVPSLLLSNEPKELETMKALDQAGAAVNLGAAPEGLWRLGERLPRLWADAGQRLHLSRTARRIVDGQGAARVASALLALSAA